MYGLSDGFELNLCVVLMMWGRNCDKSFFLKKLNKLNELYTRNLSSLMHGIMEEVVFVD